MFSKITHDQSSFIWPQRGTIMMNCTPKNTRSWIIMASTIKCLMLLKIAICVVSPKTIGTLKPWKCRYFVVLDNKIYNQVASANQQVQKGCPYKATTGLVHQFNYEESYQQFLSHWPPLYFFVHIMKVHGKLTFFSLEHKIIYSEECL